MDKNNIMEIFKRENNFIKDNNYEKAFSLVLQLFRDGRFSKSELSVFVYCFENPKRASDVECFLNWKPANTGRVLLTMYNKGMLLRECDTESYKRKGYIYVSNKNYMDK